MIRMPEELVSKYKAVLTETRIAPVERREYLKWLRFYLDFCRKYGHGYANRASLQPFVEKLASKNQEAARRNQARRAVELYYGIVEAGQKRATQYGPSSSTAEVRDASAGWTEEAKTVGPPGGAPTRPASHSADADNGQNYAEPGVSWAPELTALAEQIRVRHYSYLVPPYDLVVKLLYGCGLRISECLDLRVGCFNLDAGVLTVHDGKMSEQP